MSERGSERERVRERRSAKWRLLSGGGHMLMNRWRGKRRLSPLLWWVSLEPRAVWTDVWMPCSLSLSLQLQLPSSILSRQGCQTLLACVQNALIYSFLFFVIFGLRLRCKNHLSPRKITFLVSRLICSSPKYVREQCAEMWLMGWRLALVCRWRQNKD